MEPGRTIWPTIGAKASENERSALMSKKPAPIIIRGEGIGTITLSIITPTKTLQGPWMRMESMIQFRISVNEVVLRPKVLLKIAAMLIKLKRIICKHRTSNDPRNR
jgi:hypothetical protein